MLARSSVVVLALLTSSAAAAAPPLRACGMPEFHPTRPGPVSAKLRAQFGQPPLPGSDAVTASAAGGSCPTRPTYPNTIGTGPVRVHYQTAHATIANQVLGWAESSWTAITTTMGFQEPLPDADGVMDIYMEVTPFGGYYCPEAYYFPPDDSFVGTTGWISVNPELNDDLFTQAAVAHEIHHAVQFAYDALESGSFMEMTSAYVMEAVFDSTDAASSFIYEFQQNPQRSLDYYSYGEPYQYGASLFLFWLLDEQYLDQGNEALVYLWQASRQPYGDGTNEPDYFDALETLLAASSTNLAEMYTSFVADRWFTGDQHDGTFDEGASWWGVRTAASLDAEDDDSVTLAAANQPAEFGASYALVDFDSASADATLELTWDLAPGKTWSVLMIRPGDTGTNRRVIGDTATGTYAVDAFGGEPNMVFAFVNLGDGNHDPDAEDWAGSAVSFSIAFDDPSGGTGDDDDDDDGGSGGDELFSCSLSSLGSRAPSASVLLALSALLVLRRRRSPCA